jgi:hypothetical protein
MRRTVALVFLSGPAATLAAAEDVGKVGLRTWV